MLILNSDLALARAKIKIVYSLKLLTKYRDKTLSCKPSRGISPNSNH